jgi:hypothetical protein
MLPTTVHPPTTNPISGYSPVKPTTGSLPATPEPIPTNQNPSVTLVPYQTTMSPPATPETYQTRTPSTGKPYQPTVNPPATLAPYWRTGYPNAAIPADPNSSYYPTRPTTLPPTKYPRPVSSEPRPSGGQTSPDFAAMNLKAAGSVQLQLKSSPTFLQSETVNTIFPGNQA